MSSKLNNKRKRDDDNEKIKISKISKTEKAIRNRNIHIYEETKCSLYNVFLNIDNYKTFYKHYLAAKSKETKIWKEFVDNYYDKTLPDFILYKKSILQAYSNFKRIENQLEKYDYTKSYIYDLCLFKADQYKEIVEIYSKIENKKFFRDYFIALASGTRQSAKRRLSKGRIEAGISTINDLDLAKLYVKQQGKCFWSDIPFATNTDTKDWQCSPDRLNEDLGYIEGNVVLCCKEFNKCSTEQWSINKINQIKIKREQNINIQKLHKKLKTIYNKQEKISGGKPRLLTFNGILHKRCTRCKRNKTFDKYYTNGNTNFGYSICKKCKINEKKTSISVYLNRILTSAKSSAKRRDNMKSRNDDSADFNLTIEHIIDKIKFQHGKCYYSGIPFSLTSSENWPISIERINNKKGYTNKNTILICLEFNTMTQWNKEKFDYFYNCKFNS